MSSNTLLKLPHEVRLELLQLSFSILLNKHAAHSASLNPNFSAPITSPSTEEVIAEAEKLNNFVSNHS